jgi:hypothetical protein
MKKEWEQEVQLKHLVAMLRIEFDSNAKVASQTPENTYAQGILAGMNMANVTYRKHIERLERLVTEMYPEDYMIEDVNLSGMEEIV